MPRVIAARTLLPGRTAGEIVRLEPLSFWGGFDAATGRVDEPSHPQFGAVLTDRILVMATGRGSSSSSSVIAESIRARTAPAAIVLREVDPIIATGVMVAAELYGTRIPVVVVGEGWDELTTGSWITIAADGEEAMLTLGESI